MLAGLERPQSGTVSGISPREIAILFQENRLLPWRSVGQHLTDVLPKDRWKDVSPVSYTHLDVYKRQMRWWAGICGKGGWRTPFSPERSLKPLSDLFDYLAWRGDIPMSQAPFNPVDGLILSILSYVHFENLVPPDLRGPISLGKAAETYLALPEGRRGRVRCPLDRKLLAALARCRRFSPLGLAFAQDRFVPEEEMQFAAIAVLLEDGSAFLSFRGTDATLVGWKEDFSMSFLDAVPAQQAALDYVERFASLRCV